jgi:hypothetical protein
MGFDHRRRSPAGLIRIRSGFRLRFWSAKAPFGGPSQALDYLGRYTHRVARSNERLLDVKDGQVTFQWKDYRVKGREKSRVTTLENDEFIRRFLIHILPRGFQRIRFFGLQSNRNRKVTLATCRRIPHEDEPPARSGHRAAARQ